MIYDTKTKNLSFLKMSKKLKDEGVKNNKFMLALYDEDLQGVDPFSQNLTSMQKAKIFTEVCRNYWYYLREIAKVPQEGSMSGTYFGLHLGNMAISYANINNLNSITVLPRQQGKTVAEVHFSVWVQLFSGSYINETYLHKNQAGAADNLSRFKKYKELLPKWLVGFVTDRNDKDNLEEKYFAKRKNDIKALASAQNDAAADKLGRGSSTAMVYYDEFAFLERNEIVMNAMVPAWTTSKNVAAKNGAPYGIRITTTPNNLSLPQAKYCYSYIINGCKFTYRIYDIPTDKLKDYLHNNSGNDFLYIFYSYKELGLNQEWYDGQLRTMNNNKANAKRELDCVWPESSEGNVFDENQLDKIKSLLKPVQFVLPVNGREIKFYEKPNFNLNYIITCDCSGGASLDRSVISIVDPRDFRIVGLFFNAQIDTDSFRKTIEILATQYFPNAIINIENNSMGIALLDILMKNPEIEPRMYCEKVERHAERTLSDGQIKKSKETKISYGTNTNTSSREKMYELLPNIVDSEPQIFVSEDFYEEVKNLVRNRRGKIEARQGMHDDIVMSYLVFRYSLLYGKTFQTKFHINFVPSESNANTTTHTADMTNAYSAALLGSMYSDNTALSSEELSMIEYMNIQKECDRRSGLIDANTNSAKKEQKVTQFLDFLNNL